MAVYTEVSDEELLAFVDEYDIGSVVSCKGIAEGVENSNFLLQTERGSYILTIYEKRVNPADLPFFVGLMQHLAGQGLLCPTPLHGRDGNSLRRLCGKPAAIVSFLQGLWPKRVTPRHCAALGAAMAEMHLKGLGFKGVRPNSLGVHSWRPLFLSAEPGADDVKPGLADELRRDLEGIEEEWPRDLPSGIIHADLFPDNVFYIGERISGLIDFYFACTDFLAYDVAVCLNAWCFEIDGSLNVTKARQLLCNYQRVRPLNEAEYRALPVLCRGASIRFLLTRLYDWIHTPAGALVRRKDPLEYERKLRFHATVDGPEAYGFDWPADRES